MYIHERYYSRGQRILQDLHCINISSFLPEELVILRTAAVTDHDRDGQRHHIVSMGFVHRPPPVPCIIKRKESVSEL